MIRKIAADSVVCGVTDTLSITADKTNINYDFSGYMVT